jgi:hypothetical protein
VTSISDDLFAKEASIYAKGQSHHSLSALIVMIYLTGQSGLSKSTFLISLIVAVLILICSSEIPFLMSFSFVLWKLPSSSSHHLG